MVAGTVPLFFDALTPPDQFSTSEFTKRRTSRGACRWKNHGQAWRDRSLRPLSRRLRDPRTGRERTRSCRAGRKTARPHWNLVWFFRHDSFPGISRGCCHDSPLEQAEFLRYGSIHRNSYLNSPAALSTHLAARDEPALLFAGQITGVEGYTESSATGLLAGINLSRILSGEEPVVPPPTTMTGALYRYMNEADPKHFQPMNANFGLLDDLPQPVRDKKRKRELFAERSLADMQGWIEANNLLGAALTP